jgi:hypothetical protein
MPKYKQGDIFAEISSTSMSQPDLAIIFGHIGLNVMGSYWLGFRRRNDWAASISDPFSDLPRPFQYSAGRWVWFFPADAVRGITDELLTTNFEEALSWAASNNLHTIIINGIEDIDVCDMIARQQSDQRRIRFMSDLALNHEKSKKLNITLISLDDAFIPNL